MFRRGRYASYWNAFMSIQDMYLNSSDRLCVPTVKEIPIYALKSQYFKEQRSSMAKFQYCAIFNTFQSGNLVMINSFFSPHTNAFNSFNFIVDGDLETNACCCTHTKQEAGAWWLVDLGATYSVKTVNITNKATEGKFWSKLAFSS